MSLLCRVFGHGVDTHFVWVGRHTGQPPKATCPRCGTVVAPAHPRGTLRRIERQLREARRGANEITHEADKLDGMPFSEESVAELRSWASRLSGKENE